MRQTEPAQALQHSLEHLLGVNGGHPRNIGTNENRVVRSSAGVGLGKNQGRVLNPPLPSQSSIATEPVLANSRLVAMSCSSCSMICSPDLYRGRGLVNRDFPYQFGCCLSKGRSLMYASYSRFPYMSTVLGHHSALNHGGLTVSYPLQKPH